MTVEAFLESSGGSQESNEASLVNEVTLLSEVVHARGRVNLALPSPHRAAIVSQAQVIAPVLAGAVTSAVIGAGPAVTMGVLSTWVFVHLRRGVPQLGSGLPGLAVLTRHVSLPFTIIGLAVALGGLKSGALVQALLVSLAATLSLVLTCAVTRAIRQPTRVLLVGDRVGVGQAAASWANRPDIALVGAALLEVQGVEPLDLETFGLPTQTGIEDLAERVGRLEVDAVVVLPAPGIDSVHIRAVSWSLEGTGAVLAVRTDLDSVAPHRLVVSRLAGCAVAEIGSSRAAPHVRGLKSLMDRGLGALLLVLLSPVLLALVVTVRLDSRGPGLFTQTRIGRHGRPFTVYKLRTMCTEATQILDRLAEHNDGNAVLFKLRADPRVTRVGRWLRRTSLDELPQLINVVKGEMSLVGPRPALPLEVEQYDVAARRRLVVRPGMTGLWQVSGRSDLDWEQTVSLDLQYTDNITIGDDLRICLRTVRAVTSGRGAY